MCRILPCCLQLDQCPELVGERHPGIDPVQLVEVDRLDLEPAQAQLALLLQVLREPEDVPMTWPGSGESGLGRDDQALGIGVQRLGDQLLTDRRAVGVGRVDEVDARARRLGAARRGHRHDRPEGPRSPRR